MKVPQYPKQVQSSALQDATRKLREAAGDAKEKPSVQSPRSDSKLAEIAQNKLVDGKALGDKLQQTLADGTVISAMPGQANLGQFLKDGVQGLLADRRAGLDALTGGSGSGRPAAPNLLTGEGVTRSKPDVAAFLGQSLAALRDTYRAAKGDRTSQASDEPAGDASGSGTTEPATTEDSGSKDEGITWSDVTNFLSSVVGSVLSGAGVTSNAGKVASATAGSATGAAATVITANTSTPEDKGNEFRGWAAFVNLSHGEYYHPGMKDVDTQTPNPDSTDSNQGTKNAMAQFWAVAKALGYTEGPKFQYDKSMISQPAGDESSRSKPSRDSLPALGAGSNPRTGWAINPGSGDDTGGTNTGNIDTSALNKPRPGVKDPPKPDLGSSPRPSSITPGSLPGTTPGNPGSPDTPGTPGDDD